MQANFEMYPSKSIGMIDHSAVNPNGESQEDVGSIYENAHDWSAFLWDSQYMRYIQVVDFDERHEYVVLYQCFETATYLDVKSGEPLKEREAFNRSTREYLDITQRPIVKYAFDDTVYVQPLHFQNIKILWKAELRKKLNPESRREEEIVTYPNGQVTSGRVKEIKERIVKKMPAHFSMETLSKDYEWLDHPNKKCHYNPFDLQGKSYILESYGHRQDVKPEDGFFSHEMDYRQKEDL